jgi:hypothetical protein
MLAWNQRQYMQVVVCLRYVLAKLLAVLLRFEGYNMLFKLHLLHPDNCEILQELP